MGTLLQRIRWRRLALWGLRAAGLLLVTYLVAVNVLLRTRLLRNAISGATSRFAISGISSEVRLDYESAYSLLPGRVHVEGLTIRGKDHAVEWYLTLDRADVSIALVDLVHQSFHATRVRASGLTMRARLRLDPADATPDVVAALPPIPGYADPPLRDGTPDSPPLSDAAYDLWHVDLENVDVEHVRELWILGIRGQGEMHVRGRWIFYPQRWLDVGPASLDLEGVEVSYGKKPLATGLRGAFAITVHPFDLRLVKRLAMLDDVSCDGQVTGRALVATALELLLPRSSARLTRWEAPFDARVILDHGVLVDGTRARTEKTEAEVHAGDVDVLAPLSTDLEVHGDSAKLDVRVSAARVSREGTELGLVRSMTASVTSQHPKLAVVFDDARFAIDVEGARSKDLGLLRRYLPSSSPVVRTGLLTAAGHADGSLADGWARGAATVIANDVVAVLGPATLTGRAEGHVALVRATWVGRKLDLSGSELQVLTLSAGPTTTGAAFLTAPVVTVLARRLEIAPRGVSGQVTLDAPRLEVDSLGALHDLVTLPRGLVVDGGSGRAQLHAELELPSGALRGDGRILARGVRARAGATELVADLDCALKARRAGGSPDATDLSGSTIILTRAGTGRAAPGKDGWWGSLALGSATLRTHGGLRLDGLVHLTAKDATPATVLVSENTPVPAWAADIFRMPVLDASAEVHVSAASLEVRSFVARGGSASLRAEYAAREGHRGGAVLMNLGWIELGYDLTEGASGLVLIGPEAWYARKTTAMRDAAASAQRRTDAAEQVLRYAGLTPALRMSEARELAAGCALEARSCDGSSIENLLRATADARERGLLAGIVYAPIVEAEALWGKDGPTLDPTVVGSVAEGLRMGGTSTLDHIAGMDRAGPADSVSPERGKLLTMSGHLSAVRREGPNTVGTLTGGAEEVYFVTPFAVPAATDTTVQFRGVFLERYAPLPDRAGTLVLVGAFER